jgi:hypothetical protein
LRRLTSENHQFRNLVVTGARCLGILLIHYTLSVRRGEGIPEDQLDGYLAKLKAQPES